MPSPAVAGAAEADDHAVFGDEAEEEDDDFEEEEEEEEDESLEEDDDDEEEEDEEEKPLQKSAVIAPGEDLNTSTSTSSSAGHAPNPTTNPNPKPNLTKAPPPASPCQNGAIQAAPTSFSGPATVAATGDDDVVTPSPDRKRQKTDIDYEEKKPVATLEDSRRLFQRLWTDEDEIVILQGFLEFTSQRNSANHYHQDTGPFYEQIKNRLQLDFNKNQLVEKLRRLKKKYRNVMNKLGSGRDFAFKSSHDQATFEISRKIWSNSISRSYDHEDDDPNSLGSKADANTSNDHTPNSDRRFLKTRSLTRKRSASVAAVAVLDNAAGIHMPMASASIPNVIEETVRSCLSPLLKELLYCAVGPALGGGRELGLQLSPLPLNFGGNSGSLPSLGPAVDEKWKKQQILELEVYLKRTELVQEQIKLTLGELRALGG